MTPEFFTHNRERLVAELGSEIPVVVTAHAMMQRSGDTTYLFTQEPNFYYLTGIQEAGWRLILRGSDAWLVQPRRSATQQIFDGGMTRKQAVQVSGIKAVISTREAAERLRDMAHADRRVATLGADPHARYNAAATNPALARLRQQLRKVFTDVEDCRPALQKLRAIKQSEEIDALQQSIAVTCDAFRAAKTARNAHGSEYALQAEFDYMFTRAQALHAYDPIVAGDVRACTLHYITNSQQLGKSVLLDIGAQLPHGYTADISRSWWLEGDKPSRAYQRVHQAVVAAQRDIIDLIRPGVKLKDYAKKADERAGRMIEEAGLGAALDIKARRRFMPHAISHAMGLEVHEGFGGYDSFEPGMVLTVEPGIYLPDEGFGVRIEDDILVTDSGCENLSISLSTDW